MEPSRPPPSSWRREPLPLDLQLEIVARSDNAATIVRCAAASKTLRSAMHGPGFRLRSRAALRAAVRAGLDPALLLGVSGAFIKPGRTSTGGPARRLRLDAGDLLRSFEPVSSRDGLLVLWQQCELRVCNTSTGRVTSLPRMDHVQYHWGSGGIYRPALLSVGRAGRRSFELLVMDLCFQARVFFSRHGRWGAAREVKPPPGHNGWRVIEEEMRTSPAVVGGTAHWICRSTRSAGVFALAVHAGVEQATAIAPPPEGCLGATASYSSLTDTAGSLGMLVSEADVISMWKLSTEGWSKEVVIRKEVVTPGMGDADWTACWCVGFREDSGDLLLWMERIGLVKLNLGTKEAMVLRTNTVTPVRLQEIDLASLLQVN